RPQIRMKDKQCLTIFIDVNSIEAWTLWDSGSTTTSIMPMLAQIVNVEVSKLIDLHTLQLGTIRSRSQVKYGTTMDLKIKGHKYTTYLDVVNFDCYNMIIGTLFMHKHSVKLDFNKLTVTVDTMGIIPPAIGSQRTIPKNNPLELPSGKLKEKDIPCLHERWFKECGDMMQGMPDQLPPFHEMNHEIHLIDENRQHNYHLLQCPHLLRDEFHVKLNRYVNAKWWEPKSVSQAAPLMCIPKKDGRLQTVTDCCLRNDNTMKDVTPLLDQEMIQEDVASVMVHQKGTTRMALWLVNTRRITS
ncbi:hypothetical protein P691DRAFT_684462, partial [Macrolepiota fuliginosa MF-IS2]